MISRWKPICISSPKMKAKVFEDGWLCFSNLKNKSLPSRELTYPTLGRGKSSSKCHFWGIILKCTSPADILRNLSSATEIQWQKKGSYHHSVLTQMLNLRKLWGTVDGRNPAPVDMVNIRISNYLQGFIMCHTCQVVSRISSSNTGKLVFSKKNSQFRCSPFLFGDLK